MYIEDDGYGGEEQGWAVEPLEEEGREKDYPRLARVEALTFSYS